MISALRLNIFDVLGNERLKAPGWGALTIKKRNIFPQKKILSRVIVADKLVLVNQL